MDGLGFSHAPAPRLLALSTAVPRHVLRQSDVQDWARILFGGRDIDIERLLPAFANAGIETRYSCVPLSWYDENHGWVEKNRLYLENALDLLELAANDCLAKAGMHKDDIDAVVAISTSGIATPSLDAQVIQRLGLRRNVARLPVFGLGCVGGVLGLARAAELARAAPGRRVLFLAVELCGLTFRRSDRSKSNVIATALFGDGAAAAVVVSDPAAENAGPALVHSGEHTWPDTLGVMGWRVEEDGFGVLFSRDIPQLVRNDFRAAAATFLESLGLTFGDLDGYVCHPGGAKVLAALEEALDMPEGGLKHARDVLRDYGNMSAVTVLFVLERLLAEGRSGRYLMSALGPGFTAGFLTLEA